MNLSEHVKAVNNTYLPASLYFEVYIQIHRPPNRERKYKEKCDTAENTSAANTPLVGNGLVRPPQGSYI